MRELQTNSHCRNLILYHLIFVCKYRRKCFLNQTFAEELKQWINKWAWDNYSGWLRKFYWRKHYLWTRGYFCGSVGNISAEQVQEYLERQGGHKLEKSI